MGPRVCMHFVSDLDQKASKHSFGTGTWSKFGTRVQIRQTRKNELVRPARDQESTFSKRKKLAQDLQSTAEIHVKKVSSVKMKGWGSGTSHQPLALLAVKPVTGKIFWFWTDRSNRPWDKPHGQRVTSNVCWINPIQFPIFQNYTNFASEWWVPYYFRSCQSSTTNKLWFLYPISSYKER